jgi:uncharacterized protein (TIGR02001 family)
MKEINKKLLAGVLATLTLAASALTSVAYAEVSASVSASNMYYWRGYNLGTGDAAISGDLSVSGGGAYAGLWVSSGDSVAGTEYDVYFGWGKEFGDFGVDISYWSYNYPELQNPAGDSIAIGDFAEIVLGLSYGPISLTYYDNISIAEDFYVSHGCDPTDPMEYCHFGSEDYSYFALSADIGPVTLTYGEHSDTAGSAIDGYAHFDVTYNYNDNLSFTMGNVVDDVDGQNNDQTKFIVTLSLPIE